MNNNLIIINVLRFFALILLQVLVLNNIQFSGYINPNVYVLFILMLPVQTPGWIVLISSFLLGISIDMFSDSLGLHATASVLIAFIRPNIINILSAKEAFVELEKMIDNIQKTQFRKVHAINFNEGEFRSELEKPNMAFIDALKRGIVLFGQEKFIKFIRNIAAQ